MTRDDVIGRRIVEIWQHFEWNKEGIDWARNFYILDSGKVLFLPEDAYDGFSDDEAIPADAERIEDERLTNVCGPRIVDILKEPNDEEKGHFTPLLLLENGCLLTDVMGEYHGTGGAGIFVYEPSEIDLGRLVPYGLNAP